MYRPFQNQNTSPAYRHHSGQLSCPNPNNPFSLPNRIYILVDLATRLFALGSLKTPRHVLFLQTRSQYPGY